MFVPARVHSAPLPTIPDRLLAMVTESDRVVIEQVARNPALRETLRSINEFSKRAVEAAVNKKVVDEFLNLGITAFGTKVKDAKVYILDFLNRHPELKDGSADICFSKIVYYFAFCTQNNINID